MTLLVIIQSGLVVGPVSTILGVDHVVCSLFGDKMQNNHECSFMCILKVINVHYFISITLSSICLLFLVFTVVGSGDTW